MHVTWDLVHHFYGTPIVPFQANSSAGCAITDTMVLRRSSLHLRDREETAVGRVLRSASMGRVTLHSFTRAAAPILVLAAGLFFLNSGASAKPDYTRRTSKDCEFCHPPNSRDLNEAGRYFQEHKNSLTGYQPKQQPSKEPAKPKSPGKPAPHSSK
jgi:hypothetical protein